MGHSVCVCVCVCASVCMGILSVSAFGTNVQVCACMCEHGIVRFCACYCYVLYYCMYVCISTNSVDERGECIHHPLPLGLTVVFFCVPLIFVCFSLLLYWCRYLYLDVFLYLQSPLTFGQVNVYCALFIVRIKINNNNTSRARVTTCACSRVDAMGRYN